MRLTVWFAAAAIVAAGAAGAGEVIEGEVVG